MFKLIKKIFTPKPHGTTWVPTSQYIMMGGEKLKHNSTVQIKMESYSEYWDSDKKKG